MSRLPITVGVELGNQQKLIRAMRVIHWPLAWKICWLTTAVRPAVQLALTELGSIATEEKSPKRVLLEVGDPVASTRLVPIRDGTPPPGPTPSMV
jgi:hypothetical protein